MRHSTLLTEFTDISQRLEYLVAHSSQLVFVTGEDAAVQQGFVEAFLGQQSNNANVAFLTARRGKNNQYYRQQLAQQLDLLTSRNQSFVQAFSAREDKALPVIIAITSAENVPEEVLRELWDLVLQNRFTRNGEQVNILMFGDHEWAEEVKSWLPTNNNDKPVLLTTQTLEYSEETEVEGDLDDLIANRRKLFQQRMQARALGDEGEVSLLTTWWFKLSIAAVFLVSFSSILIWQYFDVTESALKEFTQFLFQAEAQTQDAESQSDNSESTPSEDIADSNQRVAANFSAAMESIGSANAQSTASQSPEPEPVKVNTFSQQSADSPNSEYIADISAAQLKQLRDSGTISAEPQETIATASSVTAAQQQQAQQEQVLQASIVEALNELDSLSFDAADTRPEPANESPELSNLSPELSQPNIDAEQNSQIDNAPVARQGDSEAPAQSIADLPTTEVTTNIDTGTSEQQRDVAIAQGNIEAQGNVEVQGNVEGQVNDFQVEDIARSAAEEIESSANLAQTVVAQEQPQQQPAQQQPQPQQQPQSEIASQAVEPQADTPAPVQYQYHEPVLLELPNDSYVLQVSGITTESLLEEFLVDNRLLNSVWVYKTQRYGGDWFVVLVNQSFDSLEQARNAVGLLSPDLQAVEPFAKSIAAIRNEILQ